MNILLKILLIYFNEYKYTIILLIGISCLLNLLKINVISYITANIIKSINDKNIDNTFVYYKYFICISVFSMILFNYYKYLQSHFLSRLKQWLRYYIIKILFNNNIDDYSDENFSKLNTPIIRISGNAFYLFNAIINVIIPNITILLIISFYFFYKNFYIGFIFLIGNILCFIYIYFIWNSLKNKYTKYESKILENDIVISELLNNIDKIIIKGETNNEINYLYNTSKGVIDSALNFFTYSNKNNIIINAIIYLNIFILIYYLIILFKKNKITNTIFITFITILLLYRDIIFNALNQIPEYIEFLVKMEIINKIISNIDNDKLYINNILKFNNIEFKDVSFKYKKKNKYVFKNLNFKIDFENKIIGIKGKSGKGKSTITKLMIKLYKYDGNILIDNINIKNIDPNYIRKNIIYINQNSRLFDKKVINNILYGCKDLNKSKKYLEKILQYNKIKELYNNINIYNDSCGVNGELLSGGQKQIINVINGLISDSPILILDEPTNALDYNLKIELINIIKEFKKYKKCIIIISHDKEIYSIYDKIIDLDK